MTTHADAIFAEAKLMAALMNGYVVHRAQWEFEALQESARESARESAHSCPHCDYPEFSGKFRMYDQEYSQIRIAISHERKKQAGDWFEISRLASGQVPEMGSWSRLKELEQQARHIRESMQDIWPCSQCVMRFNPTNKKTYLGKTLHRRVSNTSPIMTRGPGRLIGS